MRAYLRERDPVGLIRSATAEHTTLNQNASRRYDTPMNGRIRSTKISTLNGLDLNPKEPPYSRGRTRPTRTSVR